MSCTDSVFASMTVPALYWACRQELWGGEVNGAIGVSVILSVVILMTGLAPVLAARERVPIGSRHRPPTEVEHSGEGT